MAKFQVCYAGSDAVHSAADICRALEGYFGAPVDCVADGVGELDGCLALLVVIGPHWLRTAGLEAPDGGLRAGIEAALARKVAVIPALVEGARLPLAEQLPPSLPLVDLQEARLRPGAYFRLDMQRLLQRLDDLLVLVESPALSAEALRLLESGGQASADAQTLERYRLFAAHGWRGLAQDVDFLMVQLSQAVDLASTRLVDFALGQVKTAEGQARLEHYLFNGLPMQRNYAALYFKRRGRVDLLEQAVASGAIDEVQAFSR